MVGASRRAKGDRDAAWRPLPSLCAPGNVSDMDTRDSIVCAVDGGQATVHLARVASDLARVLAAPLDLVHVLGAMPGPARNGAVGLWQADGRLAARAQVGHEGGAIRMLDAVAQAIGDPTARRHVVPFGDPGRRVAKLAEGWGAQLIVVGTRGNAPVTDALGRVSSRLAADAPCPVLVIPHGLESHVVPLTWRARTLVCGFDGSSPAWRAAWRAAGLASRIGGSLRLVNVGAGIAADTVRDVLTHARTAARPPAAPPDAPPGRLDVQYEQRSGDPAEELERVAATATAPLIAVGSRGLDPPRAPLLGSVSGRLLQHARRPIMVVPATSAPAERAA
jgi:nucleotide-binding universal stress UspA family protein